MILNLFRERKEAKIFEKNLKEQKVNLELKSIINSLSQLNKSVDYFPDKKQLMREINILSHIKNVRSQSLFSYLLKPALITAPILIILLIVIEGALYLSSPAEMPAPIAQRPIARLNKENITNEANSIALDAYITEQKSNDALAAEIDTAFNNIPKIPQNNKPFIYW